MGSNVERLLERLDELFVEVRGDYMAAKYVSKEGRRLIREFREADREEGRDDKIRARAYRNGQRDVLEGAVPVEVRTMPLGDEYEYHETVGRGLEPVEDGEYWLNPR